MSNLDAAKKNISLEDRVAERIQKSEIGQFLDEEDLLGIARRAIDKGFFKPYSTIEGTNDYNRKTVQHPSRLEVIAREHIEAQMSEHIAKWVADHGDEIGKELTRVMEEQMAQLSVERIAKTLLHSFMGPGIDAFKTQVDMALRNWVHNNIR